MAAKKYGKYFMTKCTKPNPEKWGPITSGFIDFYNIKKKFKKSNLTASGLYYTKPHVMVNTTHIHDFDEYLCFWGANAEDINDFDAEVELYMGEEGEKYLITKPTIVYIPTKLVHCPLNFAKINKPMFFFHVRDHSVE